MFKRSWYVLCLFVFLLAPFNASSAKSQELTVMTRNLYLGADLAPVIAAQTPEVFLAAAQAALAQVAANNFPERAQALAAEIAAKNPQLVGLQEVYSFTFNGFNGPPPFRDHLADLMASLAAQGADYRVAAMVRDINIQVPLNGNLVGVTDRDVILARGDVATAVVPVVLSGCRASLDGCNYQLVATATTPLGDISIERGFVAVDAVVGDMPVRFVNTHLEVPGRELDPTNPLASIFQAAQAFELVSILGVFPNPLAAKIVVVGDINSTPQDQVLVIGPYTIIPPYMQLAGAGYTDAWTLRPGGPPGFTCCQAENLLNLDSILLDRRDVTFSREMPYGMVKVNLVGNEETDKTPSGLWPSDHAGVVTSMEFAP
jgi:endonuclease/exonuclease/phosphatase family metal-dependent hydrolase